MNDYNSNIKYRGNVEDLGDGSYVATYTVPRAGTFTVDVTYGGENILACTPPWSGRA